MNRKIEKIIISTLIIVVVGALSFPWVLYLIGLANMEGRPALTENNRISETEINALWNEFRENGPVHIERLNPCYYALFFVGPMTRKPASGERLVGYIASDYNSHHLKNRRILYWHLSCAALTVWLTRNWTTDQLLSKAQEIRKNWMK